MIGKTGSADVYTDFGALAKLRGEAKSHSQPALREAARQFESIFIQMALKSMRQATQESGLMNNDQTRLYREMYDQQIGLELSKRSRLGLADLLERQLGDSRTAAGTEKGTPAGKGLADYRREALPVIRDESIQTERRNRGSIVNSAPSRIEEGALHDKAATAAYDARTGEAKSGFDTPEEFVSTLWPHAQQAAAELGVDPKMLLAQAALESGWGKSMSRTASGQVSHNLFGIKADRSWGGTSIASTTLEYENGVVQKAQAAFRSYDSYADSFRDYVQFLRGNPRYAEALRHANDPERFIAGLQKAGYATDPAYARKVLSIYYDHTVFDGLNLG